MEKSEYFCCNQQEEEQQGEESGESNKQTQKPSKSGNMFLGSGHEL